MLRRIVLVVFLAFTTSVVVARQTGEFFNTPTSKVYLSDAEMDSEYHRVAATLFSEYQVPDELFVKVYPRLREMMIVMSRQALTLAFRAIDNNGQQKIIGDRSSAAYATRKKQYLDAMRLAVRNSFLKSYSLNSYLTFNKSDRIKSFDSKVIIMPDGNLQVVETISVYNGTGGFNPLYGDDAHLADNGGNNDEIKRGIVRAFPLYYINEMKLFQNTTFELKDVLKDGKHENYHTEYKDNGILVYTGSSDVYLPDGYYTYTLVYESAHQIHLMTDYDELAWNVTGTGWSFRIESATCTIMLPPGARNVSNHCYTGRDGSKEENCTSTVLIHGDTTFIQYKTTRKLMPYEGITVASSWSKGHVKTSEGAWYYIWNNKAVFFLPLATLFTLAFCLYYWYRYGRDPKKGVIYPQFEPPAGYSPAAIGYIYRQKFTRQLTAATIVDHAVRRDIQITVNREGTIFKHNEYVITEPAKGTKAISTQTPYVDFFTEVKTLVGTTIASGKYNSDLVKVNTKIQTYCQDAYKNKDGWKKKNPTAVFAMNRSYSTLPGIVCWIAAIWAFFGGVVKACVAGNFWHIGFYIVGLILCITVFYIFSKLLPAYTVEGRKLMDHIEGFRMFLSTADEQRFNTMAPPHRSLELYEKYLPHAIALGCENQWGKQFEDIIQAASINGTITATSAFYGSFAHDSQSFSSSFASSFSGAISSASTPPSSSSSGGSSFGGGSSGGGGGGGGGGGW